ncbi:MAG: hypothetical protein QOF19_314, partial [Alphaproteobacteria bacterium]|nr:hypothetical protein [Alphaproteobacteria bacterium]
NYVDHAMTETDPVPTTEEVPPKYPKPKSFGEFWDQCATASVGLIFDDGLNTPVPRNDGMGLVVIQGDTDLFLLRVPPMETLLEYESRFLNDAAYKLPQFYSDLFGGVQPDPAQSNTKVKRMTIHAERVGEYTLNTCG